MTTALGALMGSTEVAKRLGVDRATVNRWAESGRLVTAFKMPGVTGARLFDPADVDAFAASVGAQS